MKSLTNFAVSTAQKLITEAARIRKRDESRRTQRRSAERVRCNQWKFLRKSPLFCNKSEKKYGEGSVPGNTECRVGATTSTFSEVDYAIYFVPNYNVLRQMPQNRRSPIECNSY